MKDHEWEAKNENDQIHQAELELAELKIKHELKHKELKIVELKKREINWVFEAEKMAQRRPWKKSVQEEEVRLPARVVSINYAKNLWPPRWKP